MTNSYSVICLNIWRDSVTKNRMNDVRRLADQIKEIGEKYNHWEIVRYASNLKSYINNFELKSIKDTLEQFPIMIEQYDFDKEQ